MNKQSSKYFIPITNLLLLKSYRNHPVYEEYRHKCGDIVLNDHHQKSLYIFIVFKNINKKKKCTRRFAHFCIFTPFGFVPHFLTNIQIPLMIKKKSKKIAFVSAEFVKLYRFRSTDFNEILSFSSTTIITCYEFTTAVYLYTFLPWFLLHTIRSPKYI